MVRPASSDGNVRVDVRAALVRGTPSNSRGLAILVAPYSSGSRRRIQTEDIAESSSKPPDPSTLRLVLRLQFRGLLIAHGGPSALAYSRRSRFRLAGAAALARWPGQGLPRLPRLWIRQTCAPSTRRRRAGRTYDRGDDQTERCSHLRPLTPTMAPVPRVSIPYRSAINSC